MEARTRTRDKYDGRQCDCKTGEVLGIEYVGTSPHHYDGVSEWRCSSCLRRWGRWTKKELLPGDVERPFGRDSENKEPEPQEGK